MKGALIVLTGALRTLVVAGLALAATLAWAVDIPYLSGRVIDNAEILSPATREKLATTSKAHEDRTTNQVVVLTVPTLSGESVEEYADRVFATWKLGQKGKDNGVLVLVVPNDRKMRIEVGYGLEGTLPDVAAARIIRDRMTPRFKADDFDGGVAEGMEAIVAQLEGRGGAVGDTGGASAPATSSSRGFFDSKALADFEGQLPPWPARILLGAFIFGVIGVFTIVGVATPGVGWFLYLFLIPFWAMFPIIVVGVKGALVLLSTYLVGFPVAKLYLRSRPWYAKAAADLKRTGSASFGGMVITSGGSSSSGGSSDGGFSGGGGSSGGGGASGSW